MTDKELKELELLVDSSLPYLATDQDTIYALGKTGSYKAIALVKVAADYNNLVRVIKKMIRGSYGKKRA